MILELYIDNYKKRTIKGDYIYWKGGFDETIIYLRLLYGLKNKKWYILIFDNKMHFKELYCPEPLNLPNYITVPSIFPEILD